MNVKCVVKRAQPEEPLRSRGHALRRPPLPSPATPESQPWMRQPREHLCCEAAHGAMMRGKGLTSWQEKGATRAVKVAGQPCLAAHQCGATWQGRDSGGEGGAGAIWKGHDATWGSHGATCVGCDVSQNLRVIEFRHHSNRVIWCQLKRYLSH
ncbi:hypothetical protein E2C01_045761 [Portunus trituberculatus]|uniref:Uncharacterized protein n=1 Tax=Portunus trituberculatus TaxID=210409 RepID=A0A5B7G3A2_PORTR|nr:hypothetical protein [Portunus trituberculatus]